MNDRRILLTGSYLTAILGVTLLASPMRAFCADHSPTRSWWAFEDHGDKPGTGFVLIEQDGKVERAHFFVFIPDPPEDESGRFFRMSNIKQEGTTLTAEINAFKGHESEERSRVRIVFRDRFTDNKRVRAEVTDPDKDRANQRPQNLVFVLQGDQWDPAK